MKRTLCRSGYYWTVSPEFERDLLEFHGMSVEAVFYAYVDHWAPKSSGSQVWLEYSGAVDELSPGSFTRSYTFSRVPAPVSLCGDPKS